MKTPPEAPHAHARSLRCRTVQVVRGGKDKCSDEETHCCCCCRVQTVELSVTVSGIVSRRMLVRSALLHLQRSYGPPSTESIHRRICIRLPTCIDCVMFFLPLATHSLSPQQRRPLGLQAQPPATACTEPANNKLWSYCKGKGLEPLLCINGAELPVSIYYLGGRYEKYRVDSGIPFVSHAIQNTDTHAAGSGRQRLEWNGVRAAERTSGLWYPVLFSSSISNGLLQPTPCVVVHHHPHPSICMPSKEAIPQTFSCSRAACLDRYYNVKHHRISSGAS